MKYRCYLFTALLLLSGRALAWCTLDTPGAETALGQVQISNQNLFPGGQQVSVPMTLFSKRTTCSSLSPEQNAVYLGTPYSQPVVVKFYDNLFIEFKITPPAKQKIELEEGEYTASQFIDQLIITATPVAPTTTTRIAENGVYRLETALIISAGSGASGSFLEFLRKLIAFIFSGKWPATPDDLYHLDLNLALEYKPTTCQFVDSTLTLPTVSISDLQQNGEVSGITADHTLVAHCDSLNADLTNRGIKVTLSGDSLLPGNPRIILPQQASVGVGFILYDERQRPITLGGGGLPASVIKQLPQWQTLPDKGFNLPLRASYYVYDRNQVKPGPLEANVTINIEYE